MRSNMLLRLAMARCRTESIPEPPRSASFLASTCAHTNLEALTRLRKIGNVYGPRLTSFLLTFGGPDHGLKTESWCPNAEPSWLHTHTHTHTHAHTHARMHAHTPPQSKWSWWEF